MPEIAGISAGGMPGRVKCLHVHLGHALGAGPGVNPFGDETLALVELVGRRAVRGRAGGRVSMRRRRRSWYAGPAPATCAGIRRLVDTYTDDRRLLSKATVTLYEDVQEFRVAVGRRTARWSAAARCT